MKIPTHLPSTAFKKKKGYGQVKDGVDTWRSTIGQILTDFPLNAYKHDTLSSASYSHFNLASVFLSVSILHQG